MRTEVQIVYDLLNIVHGGRVSADDVISERLVRSFVRKHRASKVNMFFNSGASIADYMFQSLGNLEFKQKDEFEYSSIIPAVINFEKNFGIKISKERFSIPIVTSESYELSLSNPINRSSPKAKLDGQELTIFIGKLDSCNFLESSLHNKVVKSFNEEAKEIDDESKIYALVRAVLYDPSQGLNYNWTRDAYPCPSEIIDQIETSVLARDFDLMIRQRPDQADNKSQIDEL